MFCRDCGKKIKENAAVCIHCGVAVSGSSNPLDGDKEWLVTLLLCFFLGYLGVHRFYTGHTGIGIAQILTFGGCGIWWFIDFILIL